MSPLIMNRSREMTGSVKLQPLDATQAGQVRAPAALASTPSPWYDCRPTASSESNTVSPY
jgi:hypothetical protein